MRTPATLLLALMATIGPVLTGCGDDPAGGGTAEPLEVEITIRNGQVEPQGERYDVAVGQPIRLVVDSDMRDELHLHATPERSFEVEEGEGQVFEFTLDQPRVAELESHELDVLVASFAARP